MYWRLFVICITSILTFLPITSFSSSQDINISVGEEYVLELPSNAKYVEVNDKSIVSIRKGETKSIIFVEGKKTGKVALKIRCVDGSTYEYNFSVLNYLEEAKRKLASFPNLKVNTSDGKLIVSGVFTDKQQKLNFQKIKSQFPNFIIDATEETFANSNTVIKTINRVLKENDLGNMQVNAYGKILALEGSPANPQQAELAMRIANMIYPGIENRLTMTNNGAPSISIEVMFIEIRKGNTLDLGINTQVLSSENEKPLNQGLISVRSTPQFKTKRLGGTKFFWRVGGLYQFLELVQQKTVSKVLSNPKLITRSGEEATFHSGSILYLLRKTVDEKGETVNELFPVETGIKLVITPKLDPIGQIDTKIETSVSELGEIKDVTSPNMSISKVSTAVTIMDGQTIMLGGLKYKQQAKSVDRVPILADIPLIGEVFKKRNKTENEAEMLILVTINRVTEDTQNFKSSANILLDKGDKEVKFSIFD